ncbi:MAG: hypothetical protein LQ342_000112 [Letrouitia transgressa]|nr:MAG: hypothetical protein LQ342_000112 [Letrouitia transgressa]
MHSSLILALVAFLPQLSLSIPVVGSELSKSQRSTTVFSGPLVKSLRRRCGPVSQYYNQKKTDWQQYGLDVWLDNWMIAHAGDIQTNSWGFAGAFGQWALGNPDWSCRDDGSDSDCDFNACDSRVLNRKKNETRQAYYVLESTNRLHAYFQGLSEAFSTAAIASALSKDEWALTFYKDKDDKSVTALKEILNAATTVVGIGTAFAGLAGPEAGAAASAGNALFAGLVGAATPLIGQHKNDVFEKSADLGGILGKIVTESMKAFTAANNALMHGDNFVNTGDIRTYMAQGLFVNFAGVDKNGVIDVVNNILVGSAINQLWRQQKVFIMGGGPCGDNTLGPGPSNAMLCRDGKAWFLYYWEEPGGLVLNSHKWGWTNPPPGFDKLGQGDYEGVKVEEIIASSLDAYIVAGFNYNSETAANRVVESLKLGLDPGAKGAAWEGTFTIPVCDIGWAMTADVKDKGYILQPYGKDFRPHWCGLVCKGDAQTTKDFIAAAQMNNFQSPKHMCGDDPGY